MENKKEYNFEFEGKKADKLMDFVIKTQEGSYTDEKPQFADISYKRLIIEEEDITSEVEETGNNILLFGISN